MNRIKELFATDSKKLIVFITAGFPNKDSTKDLVLEAIKGGADMIEIGIPFSDPQADGPVIQEANEIALNNGITLLQIFEQVNPNDIDQTWAPTLSNISVLVTPVYSRDSVGKFSISDFARGKLNGKGSDEIGFI